MIGINGAAAHLIHPGDLVILIAYGTMAPWLMIAALLVLFVGRKNDRKNEEDKKK